MTSCFGYIRVSTPKQGEGVSLEVQKADIEKAAESRNLTIIEWFVEIETASKAGRPIFNKMAGRLRRGHAAALMVHKLDRSSRNMVDWAAVSTLMDQGIAFYIATDPMDFTTRAGRFTADMLAVLAADFSRNQREETIKGLRGRLQQGLFPYRPPLGYLKGGRGKAKPPCPKTAPLIKDMFTLYASGQFSYKSLQAEMYSRGLRNHLGGAISLHGIEKVLSNPFYHGQILIKRTGEMFDGVHEPIISAELFARVEALRQGRCGPKETKHTHLFMGLFRCGLCRGPMVPEVQKKKVYYRCHSVTCEMTSIREDRLDAGIRRSLACHQLTPSAVGKMKDRWNRSNLVSELAAQRRSILARIEDREAKLGRLTDLLLDHSIDRQTHNVKRKELIFEIGSLRTSLERLPAPNAVRQARREYVLHMSDLSSLYDAANPAKMRQLLRNTFISRQVSLGGIVEMQLASWGVEAFAKEGGGFAVRSPR